MKLIWILFFFICIGIAWLVGYRSSKKEDEPKKMNVPRDYLVGLNFLLNEETDKAVDVFIKMLEVDSDTVETHLAVAKLFRKRGEVDRAIRIHQNLIARPQLEKIYRDQSLYELGQDYLSAGMLDRAERIFSDLTQSKTFASKALRTLIDIYQQIKSWENAIQTALKYESATRNNMQTVIAQYYCELADTAFQKNEYEKALAYADQAATSDKYCVRANLLRAKVYMSLENYKSALKVLKLIKDQNHAYLSEAIDLLASCYEKLNKEDELVTYLRKLVEEYPRLPVVLILAERIRKWKGDKVAANFVGEYIRKYPSLRGLYLFINIYISNVEGRAKEDLHILQNLMTRLLANKPDYRCTSCGFGGKTLHWQCPGCKEWTTMKPIHTLEDQVVN